MDDLIERMKLANGADDCTCNVADRSSSPAEHDEYCAFPLLYEGAAKITRLTAALAKIADPLTLEVEGIGLARALRIIATMQSIAKERLALEQKAGGCDEGLPTAEDVRGIIPLEQKDDKS